MIFKYEVITDTWRSCYDFERDLKGEIEAADPEDANEIIEDLISFELGLEKSEVKISILADDGEGYFDTVFYLGKEFA